VKLKCRANLPLGLFSRLATVRRLAPPALALALGTAAAFWTVSCGGGEDAKLLPGTTAREITENLDRVKQFASAGDCVGAADAAQEVSNQVEALGGVDAKLKEALQRGAGRLDEVVTTCDEESTEALEPTAEATTTEEVEKVPPGQAKKKEKEKEKPPKEEPPHGPPEATPPEATPEPPAESVPPSEGGGAGAPSGVSPNSAVGGGD
jgi:hypothetical protein